MKAPSEKQEEKAAGQVETEHEEVAEKTGEAAKKRIDKAKEDEEDSDVNSQGKDEEHFLTQEEAEAEVAARGLDDIEDERGACPSSESSPEEVLVKKCGKEESEKKQEYKNEDAATRAQVGKSAEGSTATGAEPA